MLDRWALKVHIMILQAHTHTRSVRRGDVTISTRMALPTGVNELCQATLSRLIDMCWFGADEPGVTFDERQELVMLRVHDALELRFTAGLIREAIERIVAFEVGRLDPVTGRQDPDFDYEHDTLDSEMSVRLSRADCDLDNQLRRSDADIGIERW